MDQSQLNYGNMTDICILCIVTLIKLYFLHAFGTNKKCFGATLNIVTFQTDILKICITSLINLML